MNIFSQLKEVWNSCSKRQKIILSVYFILGLPWIPISTFACLIAKSKETKSWPDALEDRKDDIVMILASSMSMSLFLSMISLLYQCTH